MGFRRFIWWLSGNSLDEAVADYQRRTDEMTKTLQRETEAFQNAAKEIRELSRKYLTTPPMWEKTARIDLESGTPHADGNLTISLDDDLVIWLWRNAWDACNETGDWDLMNACTGIAKAIRDEGVPLGPGLRATALPNIRVIRNDLETG